MARHTISTEAAICDLSSLMTTASKRTIKRMFSVDTDEKNVILRCYSSENLIIIIIIIIIMVIFKCYFSGELIALS